MTRKFAPGLRAALAAGMVLLAGDAARVAAAPHHAEYKPAPGEGVICSLATYALVEEVGARCMAGQDPELQSEIHRAVARLDAYVLHNSKWTPLDLVRFKIEQAHVGGDEAFLCHGDPLRMYQAFRAADPARIRAEMDRLLSRPGEPSWGVCY